MHLSEFLSKELVTQFGLPVPEGHLARSAEEAEVKSRWIDCESYVVKAQIAAGGRGQAGGVRFAATPSAVAAEAAALLGTRLVTEQTGKAGAVVNAVYVEAAQKIDRSVFVALAHDPASGAPMLLASSEGGSDFEELAHEGKAKVETLVLGHGEDPDRDALRGFLKKVGAGEDAAVEAIAAAHRAFVAHDMLLLEINPFVRTRDGRWVALDAKITIDDNAAFRHPEHAAMRAEQAQAGIEAEAAKSEINFVALEGDVGVVVNGAGLGLATNDMLVDAGGRPANFMDIRTTATSFDIARGVELLLADERVKCILLNVHGGGMTVCDTVAEGVAFAYSRSQRKPPVAARLAGQNADWGLRILRDRKVPVDVFPTMTGAVARAVELTKGAR